MSALIGESWWDAGGDATINYAFAQDYGVAWTDAERTLFDAVFRAYEAVCNVTFVETKRSIAEIVENKVTTELVQQLRPNGLTWHGWHDEPGAGERSGFFDYTRSYWSNPEVGGRAYWLVLHEIGHAIGLEHPHSTWHGSGLFPGVSADDPNDAGNHGLNFSLMTVMSYRLSKDPSGAIVQQYGQMAGPMAFDIAALQEIYGAREHQTGDDTYVLPTSNGVGSYWTCIWDTGGVDTIVYDGARDATIDLRQASLQNAPGGGGWFSSAEGIRGGFSIANGVVIENARSGSGDDILRGNNYDNFLFGGGGKDTIWGGPGDDRLFGGGGADTLYGGAGNDTLSGNSGADKIYLGNDNDRDVVVAGNLDWIYQFESGEDKIDISRFDIDWVEITGKGRSWVVTADYDNDPQSDLTITVIGQKPLLSDIVV